MRNGEFIINGVHSSELKSLIQHRPKIATPSRKRMVTSSPGVDGDYLLDEDSFENTTMDLKLFIKGDSEIDTANLKDRMTHLFTAPNYVPFTPYFDSDKEYLVYLTDGPHYTQSGLNPEILIVDISMEVKPYKLDLHTETIKTDSEVTLINPYLYASKPIITLVGNGGGILKVNETEYAFNNIDDYIIVDSEIQNAYQDNGDGVLNRNDRMYSIKFPILQPGINHISAIGGITQIRVDPRWRTLV